MRKTMMLIAVVALVAAACGGDGSSTTTAAPATTTAAPATTVAEQPTTTEVTTTDPVGGPGETVAVAIRGLAFRPDSITVLVGTTVEWTNEDATDHTVSASDGSFNGNLAAGATFQAQMDTAGIFEYVCQIHPGMTGEVVVDAG
ncbi:MAG: cupredoxin domain-containing protein [Acidimicrobiia bacterium]